MTNKTTSLMTAYIDKNYENAKKTNYLNLKEDDGLITVLYDDLQNTEIEGYPVAVDIVDEKGNAYSYAEYIKLPEERRPQGKLRCFYLPYSHELYVGGTGVGKSVLLGTQIRMISSQKNKPNLFISDPKGELGSRDIKHLKKNGYRVFVLNFKDYMRSNKWNPFADVYNLKMRIVNIGKDIVECKGELKNNLKKMPPFDEFGNKKYFAYNGMAFPTEKSVLNYLNFERCSLEAELDSLINQLACLFVKVHYNNDRSWEYGAQDYFKGLLHCMLEDAADKDSGFTQDMFTVRNMFRLYDTLRSDILCTDNYNLNDHPLTRNKSYKTRSLMSIALANANGTSRSYNGVFQGAIKDWFQSHIFALTTGHDICLEAEDGSPFAVFLITRDYDKSDFTIAGVFIDWMYKEMVKASEKRPDGKNQRATHFLLDEFGNIPEINDFENKISTARSRNIWFHLMVQSYKQIEIVYGVDRMVVIRDNCNSQIFLGSQNRDTKEQYSKECGKHTVPTLSSLHNEQDYSLIELPLVTVSELDALKIGEMFVKRVYKPVFVTQFVRNYEAAKLGIFNDFFGGLEGLPYCMDAFDSPKYTFVQRGKGLRLSCNYEHLPDGIKEWMTKNKEELEDCHSASVSSIKNTEKKREIMERQKARRGWLDIGDVIDEDEDNEDDIDEDDDCDFSGIDDNEIENDEKKPFYYNNKPGEVQTSIDDILFENNEFQWPDNIGGVLDAVFSLTKINDNKYYVNHNTTFEDGSPIIVILEREDGNWFLQDEKSTMKYMDKQYELEATDVKGCIRSVLKLYEFTLTDSGDVRGNVSNPKHLKGRILLYISCLVQLSTMRAFFDNPD